MTNTASNNNISSTSDIEQIFKTDAINKEFLNIITSDVDDTIVIDEKFRNFLLGNDNELSFKKIVDFNKDNDKFMKNDTSNNHYSNYAILDSIIKNMYDLLKKFTQIFSFIEDNINDIKYPNFTIAFLDDEKFHRIVNEGEEHEQFILDISNELNDPVPKKIIELGISSINPKCLFINAKTSSSAAESERKKNINELEDPENTSNKSTVFSSGYGTFKSNFINAMVEELKSKLQKLSDRSGSTSSIGQSGPSILSRGVGMLQRTDAIHNNGTFNSTMFNNAIPSRGVGMLQRTDAIQNNNAMFNNTATANNLERPSIELMNIIREKMKSLASKKKFASIHTIYAYILALMVKHGFVEQIITKNPLTNIGINDDSEEIFRCIEFAALNDEDTRLIQCLYLMSFKYDIIKHYRFIISNRDNRSNKGNCAFWGRIMFPLLYYDVNPEAKLYFLYKLIHNLNKNYNFHDMKINIMEDHNGNIIPSNFSFNSPNNPSYSAFMQYSFIVGLFAFVNYNDIGGDKNLSKPLLPRTHSTYLQELFTNSYLNPSLFIQYNKFIKTLLSFVSPISISCIYVQTTNKMDNISKIIPFSKQSNIKYSTSEEFINDDTNLIHSTAGHAYCVARNKFDDTTMFNALSDYNVGYEAFSKFTRTASDLNKHIFSVTKSFILPKIIIDKDNIYQLINEANTTLLNYYFVKHFIKRHNFFKEMKEKDIEQISSNIQNKLRITYDVDNNVIKDTLESKFDSYYNVYFGRIETLNNKLNVTFINKLIEDIKNNVKRIESADINNYHLNDTADSELMSVITKGKKVIKRPKLNVYLNTTGKKFANYLNNYISSSQINPLVQLVKVDPNFQTNGTLVYKYITSGEIDFFSPTRDKSHLVLEIIQGGMYNIDSSTLLLMDIFKTSNAYAITKIFKDSNYEEDRGNSLYEVALNKIHTYLADQRVNGNGKLKNYYESMENNLTSFVKELEKLNVPLKLHELNLNNNTLLSGGRHNITNYFIIIVKVLLISLLLIIMIVLIINLITKIYNKNSNDNGTNSV